MDMEHLEKLIDEAFDKERAKPPKDFRPEHLKRMGVTMVKGGEE